MTNAERNFLSCGTLDVFEVDKDALCGFGAEIDGVDTVFCDTLESLEHKVELSDAGELALATNRTGEAVLCDVGFKLLV